MSGDVAEATLTFSDDFNSLSLWNGTTGTWETSYFWQGTANGSTLPGEQEWYIDAQYGLTSAIKPWVASNGVLTITAAPTDASISGYVNGAAYTSGQLNTAHTFSQTYGYFEIRAQLPSGQGFWPAFWLVNSDMTNAYELDVMEMIGSDPTKLVTTLHNNADGGTVSGQSLTVADMTTGFHTYGVDWEADYITWYFDNVAVYQIATPEGMNKDMFMILDLAVGGAMPGDIDTSSNATAQMLIDYVHVYTSKPADTESSDLATSDGATDGVTIGDAVHTFGGTDGADVLTGTAGVDEIYGGNGDDKIYGGDGNDSWLSGDAGNDEIHGGNGDDTLSGGDGDDLLYGDAGVDTIYGGDGNDTIWGGDGDDAWLSGDAGNDTIHGGDGADNLSGGAGDDILYGDAGNDALYGEDGNDTLDGGDGADWLSGGAGDDILLGGAGDDTLDGGTGADHMAGGAGNDTYMVDDAGDVVTEAAGEGTDLVISSVFYALTANVENLTLTGTVALTGTGNGLANMIIANNAGDTLYGLDGDDTLIGGTGADYLDGGAGADTLSGGAGDDIYVVDNAGDLVVETANGGVDTVRASIDYILGANLENLTLIGAAALTGRGNDLDNVLIANNGGDHLYGGAGADTLIGGTGADYLDGGVGADAMDGGAGNDVYVVDNLGDTVTELANGGVDTVMSSVNFTLGANIENLTLTGATALLQAKGNALDNVIIANDAGAQMWGFDGNDTLIGGAGNDWMNGGVGADIMKGGLGNDSYVVDNINDVVIELAGQGSDTITTTVSYTLPDNVERLFLSGIAALNGTGNALDNLLTGNDAANILRGLDGNDIINGGGGDDTLDGGAGIDRMAGGTGNDLYIVDNIGDTVIELSGEGVDTVMSSVNFTLGDNVENLTLTGVAALLAKGNALDNIIIANDAGAQMWGLDGNDTLIGGAGNDWLNGGAGADIMKGGLGNDSYVVDNVNDVVVELAGEGVDTINTTVSYTLSDNVERMVLSGVGAINGTGNALDNMLTGNDAANILRGLDGNDIISGGGGNDLLDGGLGQDILTGGAGADTFLFATLADSTVAKPDLITDLQNIDFIDLRQIDANSLVAGDQAFNIVSAFGHKAGELQLTYDAAANHTVALLDVNGDGKADAAIWMTGNHMDFQGWLL
jgi:Ca2+-binding RTX toxin-like protein